MNRARLLRYIIIGEASIPVFAAIAYRECEEVKVWIPFMIWAKPLVMEIAGSE